MASWPFLLTARPHCSSFSLNFNPVNWYFVACFITDLLMNSKIVKYWRRQWHPTPVLLSGKSMDGGAWLGCSPWGREELDMTEWLPFHFSLSCIGEENGSPLQCSCLENPRDGGAWWAAVYGVAQSRSCDLAAALKYFLVSYWSKQSLFSFNCLILKDLLP